MNTEEAIGALKGLKMLTGTVANKALDMAIAAIQVKQGFDAALEEADSKKPAIPVFFPANDREIALARRLAEYEEREIKTMITSGYNFEQLLDLFLKGYELTPPAPPKRISELFDEEAGS